MDVEATIYDSESCGGKKRKDTMDANMGRDVMKSKRPRRRTIISIVEAEKAGSIIAAVASVVSSGGSSVIKSPVSGIKTQ